MDHTHCKFLIGNRFTFSPQHNSLADNLQPEETIYLGINESRALHLLLDEPGTIISRQRMHDFIWREQGFEVDDSSLTQSISTLRKYLQDSTRSPAFIKTIPKRGYQMIASVDRIDAAPAPPADIPNGVQTDNNDGFIDSPKPFPVSASLAEDAPDTTCIQPATQITHAPATRRFFQPRYMFSALATFILCIVLPLWAYLAPPPSSSAFYKAFMINDIPVLIPSEVEVTGEWRPLIRQCVSAHMLSSDHKPSAAPAKIIVTGGAHNQLWINLIYTPADYRKNMTLTIVTLDRERDLPCSVH
ncbi:winged helix-turn-helix domain-containing protein [Photobacterium sp. WH77]|uniref:transcriptional regulator n=1 Tax=Photobacterium TaxID=657 RepID=UPI001EDAD73F|nr:MULTISPECIES: winged helix-turn-helix domain-containing protein [Photobacterium]MCG2836190.1 winged helix-turn-helix domain-containing protein [Photobacterium sp. WH77]MCG2843673.1 winged helix-turn-helix domain-containing protein [Photobacterium sp. WH80]